MDQGAIERGFYLDKLLFLRLLITAQAERKRRRAGSQNWCHQVFDKRWVSSTESNQELRMHISIQMQEEIAVDKHSTDQYAHTDPCRYCRFRCPGALRYNSIQSKDCWWWRNRRADLSISQLCRKMLLNPHRNEKECWVFFFSSFFLFVVANPTVCFLAFWRLWSPPFLCACNYWKPC